MKFEWYHVISLIFIYFNLKKQKEYKNESTTDKIAMTMPNIPNVDMHTLLLCMIPFGVIASKIDVGFLENLLAFISIVLGFRCIQKKLDESTHIDHVVPIMTMLAILSINKQIISVEYIYPVYSYLCLISILRLSSKKTSTLQVMNDIISTHSLFYIFKYY